MISIIVSIYNGEKYLNRCFESLKNQTCKDFEIILVNDGSIDTSKKICEDFVKKNKNAILVNKENGGLSSARLEGYKKSSGEYIIFIDCDDYLECDFIESYIDVIKNNNDIDLIICNYSVVDNNDKKNVVSLPLLKGINNFNIIENFLVPSISRSWNENLGIPNFLFKINGGISIPPVLAPHLITKPIATPIIIPAKITHNKVSLLIISFLKIFSKIPKING